MFNPETIVIEAHCDPTIPLLAWCARQVRGDGSLHVLHGTQVETGLDFIAAGAWDGRFDRDDLAGAHMLSGTAFWVEPKAVVFSSSSDTHGPLFSLRTGQQIFVSNSLFFLLRMTGTEPDPTEPFYALRIVRALRECWTGKRAWLPLRSGKRVGLHFAQRLRVSKELEESISTFPAGPEPTSYADYRQQFLSGVASVLRNAADPMRRHVYGSAATLSRGYDSTATATAAAAAGCKLAVSLSDSRRPEPMSDCGAEIASMLGMQCTISDRWDYQSIPDLQEEESAFSTFGLQLPVTAFEETLRGKIVVAGALAGVLNHWESWDKPGNYRQRMRLAPPRVSGLSNLEQRLRIGSVSFLPMVIAARHLHALDAISRSEEMAPWRIGGSYDRPIARRLIEEAGIPREAFGRHKRGGGHASLVQGPGLTPRGRERYKAFLEQQWQQMKLPARAWMKARVRMDRFVWKFVYGQKWMAALMNRLPLDVTLIPGRREDVRWPYLFMLQWSHSVVSRRYPAGFPDFQHHKSKASAAAA
jgi:hypothetical protein